MEAHEVKPLFRAQKCIAFEFDRLKLSNRVRAKEVISILEFYPPKFDENIDFKATFAIICNFSFFHILTL